MHTIEAGGPSHEQLALSRITHNDKYVIVYDFSEVGASAVFLSPPMSHVTDGWLDDDVAIQESATLLEDLESVGLHTEVRPGYDKSLLVFVKAPQELLGNSVYQSRYAIAFLPNYIVLLNCVKGQGLAVRHHETPASWDQGYRR